MSHTWTKHSGHGGYWQCPDDVLDTMRALGWEPSEPPEEPNPAAAERIAWEREQAATQAAKADQTKPKAARRGTSE